MRTRIPSRACPRRRAFLALTLHPGGAQEPAPLTWETVSRPASTRKPPAASLAPCSSSANDEVVLSRGYGVANRETGAPVTPDTIFGIGSTPIDFHESGHPAARGARRRRPLAAPITAYFEGRPEGQAFDHRRAPDDRSIGPARLPRSCRRIAIPTTAGSTETRPCAASSRTSSSSLPGPEASTRTRHGGSWQRSSRSPVGRPISSSRARICSIPRACRDTGFNGESMATGSRRDRLRRASR